MPPRTKAHPPNTRQRGDTLVQSLTVLRLLRTGRWRVETLAAELGVTTRTVYRLLHALERAGIEIESQREGREVYYRITRATLERALGLRAP